MIDRYDLIFIILTALGMFNSIILFAVLTRLDHLTK